MPEFAVDSASRFDFHLQPFLGLAGGLFNQSDYIGFDVSRAPLPARQDNPPLVRGGGLFDQPDYIGFDVTRSALPPWQQDAPKCARSGKAVNCAGAHPQALGNFAALQYTVAGCGCPCGSLSKVLDCGENVRAVVCRD